MYYAKLLFFLLKKCNLEVYFIEDRRIQDEVFERIRKEAINQKVIIGDLIPEEQKFNSIDYELLKQVQDHPAELHVDEINNLLSRIEEGQKVYIPELSDGFTLSYIWLSDFVP